MRAVATGLVCLVPGETKVALGKQQLKWGAFKEDFRSGRRLPNPLCQTNPCAGVFEAICR